MSRINGGRVLLGGLVAGLVMNVIDFIVNVPVLGAQWEAATRVLNVPMAETAAMSATGWIVSDFIAGILLVWVYAAMRPRFGPGPKTAAIASVFVSGTMHVAYACLWFLSLYPLSLVAASTVGALVAALAGGQAGCRLYKEDGPAARAAVL